jgi:hypothetical protein
MIYIGFGYIKNSVGTREGNGGDGEGTEKERMEVRRNGKGGWG